MLTHPSRNRNIVSERFPHFRSKFESDKMLLGSQARVRNRTRTRHRPTLPGQLETRLRLGKLSDVEFGAVCDRSVVGFGFFCFDPRIRCRARSPPAHRSFAAERIGDLSEVLPI